MDVNGVIRTVYVHPKSLVSVLEWSTMQVLTVPTPPRVRLTRLPLWVVGGLLWALVVLGWPLLSLAQLVFTPEVKGSAIGIPPTLSDVGFLIFIISVPAAVAVTGLALVSALRPAANPRAAVLRATGLIALVLVLTFVAFMAAQIIGFFILSPVIDSVFQLN